MGQLEELHEIGLLKELLHLDMYEISVNNIPKEFQN